MADTRLYRDQFAKDVRVEVRAGIHEGTDRYLNGRKGIVLKAGNASAFVLLDRPRRHHANPCWITCHNLRELAPNTGDKG